MVYHIGGAALTRLAALGTLWRMRRTVRGKFCGGIREEIGPLISSWPGLARPSTPSRARNKDVDTRIKSAQDDLRLTDASPRPVIRARKISPENPRRAGEACKAFGRFPV
jgi:hypothetical protein